MKKVLPLACLLPVVAFAQRTPPIQPNLQPVPLPQAVTLPEVKSADFTKPISADEAAAIALRMQPTLRVAQAAVLAALGRYQEARSALLPTIGLTSGYTKFFAVGTSTASSSGSSGSSSGTASSASTTGYSSSIALRQLIFDFNHTRDLVRQAQALQDVSRQALTRAQLDLILQVKLDFYTYVQNQRLVDVQQANLDARQGQLALAQARLNAGIGQPADVVTAEAAVADASQALALARAVALTSRVALALAMGVDGRTPIASADSSEAAPATDDLNALVDQALRQRPEILQSQAAIRAAQFELSAARSSLLPSVAATAGYTSRGSNDPLLTQGATIGVALSVPIFDAGFSAGATNVARSDVATAQANLATATQTAVSDVSQAYVNLRTSEQRVTIAQSGVANASEALRLAEGRFRAGVTTFLDVTTAQANLVTAQTTLVNSQALVQLYRATLRRAIGSR